MGNNCGKNDQADEDLNTTLENVGIKTNGPSPDIRIDPSRLQHQGNTSLEQASNPYGTSSNIDYDKLEQDAISENYARLKENFFHNPVMFLTNQLLLSTQFFKNFEKDKADIRAAKHDLEEEMRDALSERRQRALLVNMEYDKIHDNLGFKSFEQEDILEPLLPTEFYISHEFIETNRKEDFERLAHGSMDYSQVDEPYYRTCIEGSDHYGYAKIRCVDDYENLIHEVDTTSSGNPTTASTPNRERIHADKAPLEPQTKPRSTLEIGNRPSKKSDLIYDKFPSPIESKKKNQFKPTEVFKEEDEDEDMDSPETGAELFKGIEDRLKNANTSNNTFIRSPAKNNNTTTSNRLGPRNPNSDPNAGNKRQQIIPSVKVKRVSEEANKTGEPTDSPASKANSIYSLDEDAYGYVRASPKDLAQLVAEGLLKKSKHNMLPSRCFEKIEEVENEYEDDAYPISDGDEEKVSKTYLKNRPFMQHFATHFEDLAKQIDKGSLHSGARILDPKIMTREEKDCEGSFAKEASQDFIPTVDVGFWPDEGIEWSLRKRVKVKDRRTQSLYQWPSSEIVSQYQQMGCNLVPVGFIKPKRGKDVIKDLKQSTIQWEIQFVRAEQLIQRSFNHPMTRCLLFINLIYKTFISDLNSVTPRHLRYMLYWMVEREPVGWIDEQLGLKLIKLIKEMKHKLTSNKFPHYFISKKNMFDTLPKHRLMKAHEKFHRLQENFVPYLMSAIQRLHMDKFFYPLPNVEELYNILTTTQALTLINPQLLQTAGAMGDAQNPFERSKKVQEFRSTVAKTQMRKGDASQERMRQRHRRKIEEKTAKMKEQVKQDKDVINKNIVIDRFDQNRGRLILEFFISHFTLMARKSNEFSSYGQSRMYLNQADNLMKLLKDNKLYGTSAHMGFETELEQLRQVSRGTSKDYWNLNWGVEDRASGSSLNQFGPGIGSPSQAKVQNDPLPNPPQPGASPAVQKNSAIKDNLKVPGSPDSPAPTSGGILSSEVKSGRVGAKKTVIIDPKTETKPKPIFVKNSKIPATSRETAKTITDVPNVPEKPSNESARRIDITVTSAQVHSRPLEDTNEEDDDSPDSESTYL